MVILIADDDRLIRFSLKSILGGILENSEHIFLEASNGKEMIQICREKMPDVAFVDICMPFFNGLDAIAECKKEFLDTEFVIVSGYSNFEYAKRGIQLGITEYLLKPVEEEQMKAVMEKVEEKLGKRKRDSNSRFLLRVMETFYYHYAVETEEYREAAEEDFEYLTFLFCVKNNRSSHKEATEIQAKLLRMADGVGKKTIRNKGCYAVTYTGEGLPCVIFQIMKEQKEAILSEMKKICLLIKNENPELFYFTLWFEENLLELVYERCEKFDGEAFLMMQRKSGELCRYEDISLREDSREWGFLRLLEGFLDAWNNADGIACKEIMNDLWRSYKDHEPKIRLENLAAYCSFMTGCEICAHSFKLFCKSLVENSDHMYGNFPREESDMIVQVKEYMQKFYMNDVSIGQIAEHFGLTPNYLSTVFHRKAGEKFIDYLTEIRIDNAKRLLLGNPSASIQDIALMVGYNSARHFSALFQKQTGVTPTVYRKTKV